MLMHTSTLYSSYLLLRYQEVYEEEPYGMYMLLKGSISARHDATGLYCARRRRAPQLHVLQAPSAQLGREEIV